MTVLIAAEPDSTSVLELAESKVECQNYKDKLDKVRQIINDNVNILEPHSVLEQLAAAVGPNEEESNIQSEHRHVGAA